LKVAILIYFSCLAHHEGTRPHRIGNNLPSRSITASILIVGHMF
jgi:hypothetical protein